MSPVNMTSIMIDSKSELIEKIKESDSPKLIIGKDSQTQDEFYIIRGDRANIELFKIGVISESHGLKPKYKQIDGEMICIGFNKEIHIFNIKNISTHYKVVLDSLFYEFIEPKQSNQVIALHELGVTCASLTGVIIWNHVTEIICSYKVYGPNIELQTEESIITLHVPTGEVIAKRKII